MARHKDKLASATNSTKGIIYPSFPFSVNSTKVQRLFLTKIWKPSYHSIQLSKQLHSLPFVVWHIICCSVTLIVNCWIQSPYNISTSPTKLSNEYFKYHSYYQLKKFMFYCCPSLTNHLSGDTLLLTPTLCCASAWSEAPFRSGMVREVLSVLYLEKTQLRSYR